jgi:hypothetical protein
VRHGLEEWSPPPPPPPPINRNKGKSSERKIWGQKKREKLVTMYGVCASKSGGIALAQHLNSLGRSHLTCRRSTRHPSFISSLSSLLFISSSALSSSAHLLTCSPARQPVTNYQPTLSLSYLLTSEMPPLRKDRAQASSRRQYDNTLQFNTFINVSIPKAPQVLSEEAIQLRPTIPAKTVRDLSIPYHITLKCTPPARRIALRYCLCLPLTPETRFGRTKGQLAHPQEACRSHQPPSKCIHPLQVPPFHLSS